MVLGAEAAVPLGGAPVLARPKPGAGAPAALVTGGHGCHGRIKDVVAG